MACHWKSFGHNILKILLSLTVTWRQYDLRRGTRTKAIQFLMLKVYMVNEQVP